MVTLFIWCAIWDSFWSHESIKWIMNQTDLKGPKARWAEILQEYNCKLRYRKGRYNIVADALSCMPKINLLLFTELKRELLESLWGKCEQDSSYSKVWNHVKWGVPLTQMVVFQFLPHKVLLYHKMNCSDGNIFLSMMDTYSTRGEFVFYWT